ncbi:hypothetical protein [Asticcacaulis sp.]|uniref:hypothetical protein n=1 Tax=Asticcacaulis sp. TaxID=1872648 RepID=UPI0031D140F2
MTVNIEAASTASVNAASGSPDLSSAAIYISVAVAFILIGGIGGWKLRDSWKPKTDPIKKPLEALKLQISSFLSHVEKIKKAVEQAKPYAPPFTSGISGHEIISNLIKLSVWDGDFEANIEKLQLEVQKSTNSERLSIFNKIYVKILKDALEELKLCLPDIYFIHSQITLGANSFEHSRNRFLIEDCQNKMKAVIERLERVQNHGTWVLNELSDTFKEPEKRPGIIASFFAWLNSILFPSKSK